MAGKVFLDETSHSKMKTSNAGLDWVREQSQPYPLFCVEINCFDMEMLNQFELPSATFGKSSFTRAIKCLQSKCLG